jgi:hypothetical protein
MTVDVDKLMHWVFDPERRMWSHLDSLKDDLRSDDPEVHAAAEEKVLPVLVRLLPSLTGEAASRAMAEQRESLRRKLADQGVPNHIIEGAVKAVRVRERGRPRSRNFDAIAGLRLYWFERKSWRDIVLEVSGSCKYRGCKSYCAKCGDVARSTKLGRLGGRRRLAAVCIKCHFRLRPPEQREQVCWKCSDAMADLVVGLEAFLRDNDIARSPQSVMEEEELGEK